ncbi:uncharacterized protein LOC113493056 [Trichoplusia ni]|uniref:Uncharacterized protein LOC113493056 n=1 Tax=Trichoplusia ni TaxID=7111 RepID=A0A7E5VEA7_TRINI|nr:uncharacterized protein LOC113493056 [Trichoplusia ni]
MGDHAHKYDYSSDSFTSVSKGVSLGDPKFNLQLVYKKDPPTGRPLIMSSKHDRLAFYRAYSSSSTKTEIVPTQSVNINSFLWLYTLNLLFKSLPHGFVHFFIAAYAPEEHMFVTKMVPFSTGAIVLISGLKYLFTMVGFFELLSVVDLSVMLFHYSLAGMLLKNPWNRCPTPSVYHDNTLNVTMRCLELHDFAHMFENRSYEYANFTFVYEKDYHFQVAQIEYYRYKSLFYFYHFCEVDSLWGWTKINEIEMVAGILDIVEFIILWSAITIFHLQTSSKYFWKLLNWSQWSINIVDLMNMGYLTLMHYSQHEEYRLAKRGGEEETRSQITLANIQMLAESITAPSIVHVLTSRSVQEIDPARDSTTMVISNAVLFIFRGLLGNSVKHYCETMCHTEIPITQFNQHSWFYFWPMYWTSFYLGDIFSLLYLMLNLLNEVLITTVIYKCVVECIIYEWKRVRRWMVMLAFAIFGLVGHIFITVDDRVILWIYGKGIATLSETIFLYVLYPVGRLVDDFIFHYGVAPTNFRIMSLRLVPVYYLIKLYLSIESLWEVLASGTTITHYMWTWTVMVVPILIGNLYIIYRYLGVYKMTWNYIFRPLCNWGPRDFTVRQLRKQFDSRHYIGSEAPKLLSRYLMSKRESKIYKIDVRYDFARRSTVYRSMPVRFGVEERKFND